MHVTHGKTKITLNTVIEAENSIGLNGNHDAIDAEAIFDFAQRQIFHALIFDRFPPARIPNFTSFPVAGDDVVTGSSCAYSLLLTVINKAADTMIIRFIVVYFVYRVR